MTCRNRNRNRNQEITFLLQELVIESARLGYLIRLERTAVMEFIGPRRMRLTCGKDVFMNEYLYRHEKTFLASPPTTNRHLCIRVSGQKKKDQKSLRHAPNKQSSNALLLASHCDLGRHATLGRKRHLHQSGDFASAEGFAVQLQGVRAG